MKRFLTLFILTILVSCSNRSDPITEKKEVLEPNVFERGKNISEIQGIVSKINSENPTICCDYSEGWGKFVTSDWINKKSIPFSSVNCVDADMSLNENRLARLWKSATKIYPSVSRG